MKFIIVVSALFAVAFGATPKLDGRIVGGKLVDIENFPYQASVRIYDQHICGGSIIDANTVLTAAHCVHDMDQTQFSVRVGDSFHNYGQKVRVSEVRKNSNYDPDVTNNDMAILKLASSLNFGSTIQPVALQPAGNDVSAGVTAWVSGWGVTSEGSSTVPEALRAVDVEVITNDDCARKYGPNMISSKMMCAQTLYQDSCQGDSGGPLVANSRLIGVVSWGFGCARPQYPGVYASVAAMNGWVQSNRY